MTQRIQIRRGLKIDLPILEDGELGWCTDTKELYIGTSSKLNVLINGKHDNGGEKTGLPRIFLTGNMSGISKDNKVTLGMTYDGNGKDSPIDCNVEMKWQGDSSLVYPKKNFKITLRDKITGKKMNANINRWGEADKYTLKANYIDATHSLNIVNARLWGEVVGKRSYITSELRNTSNFGAVDGFPIELYINDEHQGLYTVNIEKGNLLYGMDDTNPNHAVLRIEENDIDESAFISRPVFNGLDWDVKFPDELLSSVRDNFYTMFDFVSQSSLSDFENMVENYFDLESLIDYYVFAYTICDIDSLGKNMMLYTYDGGQKWIASMYDLDSTWGLWWDGTRFVSSTYRCPEDYEESKSRLWQKVVGAFEDRLATRYKELRESVLSYNNIVGKFEGFINSIPKDSYDKDKEKNTGIPNMHSNNLERIKTFVYNRLKYVDGTYLGKYMKKEDNGEPSNPNVIVRDSFNRPNSNTLGVTETGQSWIVDKAWEIYNNQARVATDGMAVVNSNVSDCIISIDNINRLKGTGIAFRVKSVDWMNGFIIEDNKDSLTLYQMNTWEALATVSANPYVTMKVELNGENIKIYLDDVIKIDVNSSHNKDATMHGMGADDVNATFDNFLITGL